MLRGGVAYAAAPAGPVQVKLAEGGKGCGKVFELAYTGSGAEERFDVACGESEIDGKAVLCPECTARGGPPP